MQKIELSSPAVIPAPLPSLSRRAFVLGAPAAIFTLLAGCKQETRDLNIVMGRAARTVAYERMLECVPNMLTIEQVQAHIRNHPFKFSREVREMPRDHLAQLLRALQGREQAIGQDAFASFCQEYSHRQRHGTDAELTREDIRRIMDEWIINAISDFLAEELHRQAPEPPVH